VAAQTGPGRLSRRSCGQNYPTTIGANASTCASRFAMFPGSDGPVLASGHESSPRSTRPPGPHKPCAPGNAPTPGFAVAGNLLRRSKSYSVAPIAVPHEACDQNRPDAASRGNKDSPFDKPPGPNPHRLSPAVGVALDPPDGSGTKSLCFSFSHIEMESKSPLGGNLPGGLNLPDRIDHQS
jgi:hypothetical protein